MWRTFIALNRLAAREALTGEMTRALWRRGHPYRTWIVARLAVFVAEALLLGTLLGWLLRRLF